MIKQTWEISQEERNRIILLHESATKNLYLVSEQGHDPFQGPGSSSYVLDQDQDYMYFVSQVTYSVTGTRINWQEQYFIYAMDMGGSAFRCEITGKDEKGQPTGVKVLTDKPLPILSQNPETNEFKIGLVKTSKKTWKYTFGDKLTKNGLQGEEKEKDLGTGRYLYGVLYRGRPATAVVDFTSDGVGTYNKEYDINFTELEINSTTYFNPDTEGFYMVSGRKISGRFSAVLLTTFSGQPFDPEFFNPGGTPEDTPEFEEIKLDIQSPFEFDKTTLTPEAEIEFKKFIEKVKSNYQGVSGNVEVIASASIDGDENQKRDYNQKLSDNRASTISNRLKTETGISTLNFIPKGIGQTDQFAKGMKYPEVKDVNQTSPNRRLIIKMPTLTKEKQK